MFSATPIVVDAAISTLLGGTVEYRLHTIRISPPATAIVYDGEQKVYEARDKNLENAMKRAQQWIDEQDEYPV